MIFISRIFQTRIFKMFYKKCGSFKAVSAMGKPRVREETYKTLIHLHSLGLFGAICTNCPF